MDDDFARKYQERYEKSMNTLNKPDASRITGQTDLGEFYEQLGTWSAGHPVKNDSEWQMEIQNKIASVGNKAFLLKMSGKPENEVDKMKYESAQVMRTLFNERKDYLKNKMAESGIFSEEVVNSLDESNNEA